MTQPSSGAARSPRSHRTSSPQAEQSAPDPTSAWHYETSVREIEAIIARIESGELDLAEVFEQFAGAIDRLQQCESFLNQQQRQMDLLVETLVDGPDAE
ncbi:MAG: exodeoxyribonuclease VII small subunit [Kaiparowitsia implicata GSE-PSE-MK54-09C]|jgi:exodeoxyribonuclease VII small subunit|nr:exodeoxyribonuclease VII small subunit [Kaiparowitsia implicata GSE-PSE-MK54-09C]